ncbi:MAG: fructosamine kinase family protein [Phycisphaerales bacterium JB052]
MPHTEAIHSALRSAGITPALRTTSTLSADAHQQVIALTLDDGSSLVAKITPHDAGDRLHAEADSLRALSKPGILLVPRVHALCDTNAHTVLLMDKLEHAPRADDSTWATFGRDLAAHHQATPLALFGWSRNNFLGPTPQPNAQTDDWVDFNATSRIGYQLELAKTHGRLTARESEPLQRVIDRLPDLIPRHPAPALIHGDLWSGNAIATLDPDTNTPRIAVIDPAVSIGDPWADIAMMQLFGGFPKPCLDAYILANPDHDRLESRIGVYQLYHMLNHLNIFGTSYKHSALSIAQQLLAL